jgi:hypothetical protein
MELIVGLLIGLLVGAFAGHQLGILWTALDLLQPGQEYSRLGVHIERPKEADSAP